MSNKIQCALQGAALGLAALVAMPAFAGKDTPEGMMTIARQEGVASSAEMLTAVNEVSAFYNRVATDKAYAGKLLEAIQKSDHAGITAMLKSVMTRSTITVGKINPDFHIQISVKVGKTELAYCFSSDGSCDGHNVTLG